MPKCEYCGTAEGEFEVRSLIHRRRGGVEHRDEVLCHECLPDRLLGYGDQLSHSRVRPVAA